MIRSWFVRALLVVAILFCITNIAYGQIPIKLPVKPDTIQADTMNFTFVGPAVKGDTFVTVRRVNAMLDEIGTHVDDLGQNYLRMRAWVQHDEEVIDSLQQVIKKSKGCKIGDSLFVDQKKKN